MNEKQKKAFNVYRNVGLLFVFALEISSLKSFVGLREKFGEKYLSFFTKEKKSAELKKMDSDLRKEMTTSMKSVLKEAKTKFNKEETKELNQMFDDKTCDDLIKIVGKYKFDLPPLTEELSADHLVEYIYLSFKEDRNYVGVIEELNATKIFKENVTISAGLDIKIEPGKQPAEGVAECSNCGGLATKEFTHAKTREGTCMITDQDGGRCEHSK